MSLGNYFQQSLGYQQYTSLGSSTPLAAGQTFSYVGNLANLQFNPPIPPEEQAKIQQAQIKAQAEAGKAQFEDRTNEPRRTAGAAEEA